MYKLELPEGHLLGAVMRWFSLPHGSLDISAKEVRRVVRDHLDALRILWEGGVPDEYEPLVASVCDLTAHLVPVAFLGKSGLVLSVEYIDDKALCGTLGLNVPEAHQDMDFFVKVELLDRGAIHVVPGVLSSVVEEAEDLDSDHLILSGHPEAAYAFSCLRQAARD